MVHAPLAAFMEKFRTGYFGRRGKFQKMTTPLVVKEILEPGSTANPMAKAFAKAINEAIELGRTRHNQWGANAVVEEPDSKFWHRVSNLRKMVDTAPEDMRHIWVTKLRKIMEKVGPKT